MTPYLLSSWLLIFTIATPTTASKRAWGSAFEASQLMQSRILQSDFRMENINGDDVRKHSGRLVALNRRDMTYSIMPEMRLKARFPQAQRCRKLAGGRRLD